MLFNLGFLLARLAFFRWTLVSLFKNLLRCTLDFLLDCLVSIVSILLLGCEEFVVLLGIVPVHVTTFQLLVFASMNSLWPATFWMAGRQTLFASSFAHAEKTTAKSTDGRVAPGHRPLVAPYNFCYFA